MGLFSDYNATSGTLTITGCITAGTSINVIYPYHHQTNFNSVDVRGNSHVDLDRLAELQKLVAKHPQRTDLKMELMKLQSRVKPKIGKRKKKK
jgi:hypothetical protein